MDFFRNLASLVSPQLQPAGNSGATYRAAFQGLFVLVREKITLKEPLFMIEKWVRL